MKTMFILCFCLMIFACSKVSETSKQGTPEVSQFDVEKPDGEKKEIPTSWRVRTNDRYARTGQVGVVGQSPNGPVDAVLEIQCPTAANSVISFSFIVRNTDTVADFDFDSFEGPDA